MRSHYTSANMSLVDRIAANLDTSGECWIWTGSLRKTGYGQFTYNYRVYQVHVAMMEIMLGERVPKGLCVCHHCDNPSCCNPSHLFLGSHADNMRDKEQKGRHGGLKQAASIRGENHWVHRHPERIARGERQGKAKLTYEKAAAIRARYAAGDITQTALAREYGVSQSVISELILGNMWK